MDPLYNGPKFEVLFRGPYGRKVREALVKLGATARIDVSIERIFAPIDQPPQLVVRIFQIRSKRRIRVSAESILHPQPDEHYDVQETRDLYQRFRDSLWQEFGQDGYDVVFIFEGQEDGLPKPKIMTRVERYRRQIGLTADNPPIE